MSADSGPFSIWQRSKQVSEWFTAEGMPEKGGKIVDAGEIEVTDEVRTVTLRKKERDTAVRVFNLMFEKIE